MKKFITLIVLFGCAIIVNAQIDLKDKLKGYVNPAELVTISETLPFNQAIEVISKVSEKINGKRVVSTTAITSPIGVEIDKMQYKKALLIIAQFSNLTVEETENALVVKKKDDSKDKLTKDTYAPVSEREVKISALIFEADVSSMQEKGVNWEFLLSRSGLSIGGKLVSIQQQQQQSGGGTGTTGGTATSQTTVNPPDFSISPKVDFSLGKQFDGTATGMFKFFESENLGKIISRPEISTVNGIQGRTQVGSEFSIKERDFAGNLIDKFFQSGTIIEVTPNVYSENGINYIFLKVRIEKSSVILGSLSVEKPKTEVTTNIMLLDGEETAIGGLLVNEEQTTRRGVPFLRDLPWWVLGLRYIFGYDQITVSTKEIITLLKVELVPTLKERMENMKRQVLTDEIKKHFNEIEKYKEQIKNAEPKKEDEK